MFASDDHRQIRFWRPNTSAVTAMFRVDREDRLKTVYAEDFAIVVVYAGAFDAWYRGGRLTHVAGEVKLKEPGEVHRDVAVHVPFTLQGAKLAPALVAEAAASMGARGAPQFRAPTFAPGTRAAALAFAMHDALVSGDATELERATLVTETLSEVLCVGSPKGGRAPLAVRRARAFLHDALTDKITLDDLAEHASLDKFHLVRSFRAEVGLPPYEYLTYLRVARAKKLLERGLFVAEAAQAVGFYDESQLHRHFRRIVGISPGRYARCLASRGAKSPTSPKPTADPRGMVAG